MDRRHTLTWARILALLLLLSPGLTGLAHAADGAIEINETRALAGGINGSTVTDPPGYPVVISAPGGYILTGNLNVDAATTAIQILVDEVSIDFNGFGITGAFTNGTGKGVVALGPGVSITNGFVRGVGDVGIELLWDSRAERMAVRLCGGAGISAQSGSQVIANRVADNRGGGLVLQSDVGYVDNVIVFNTGGPAVSGGLSLGGNLCDGQPCTDPRPRLRRFYLTQDLHNGGVARSACEAGFHMASVWEVRDPTNLEYDPVRGSTQGDSGQGPPSEDTGLDEGWGWIRSGHASNAGGAGVLEANCNGWTTPSGNGLTGRLLTYSSPYIHTHPWALLEWTCATGLRVWCIED